MPSTAKLQKQNRTVIPRTAKLQKQNRTVIPREIVEHLGAKQGDELYFQPSGKGRVVLTRAEIKPAV